MTNDLAEWRFSLVDSDLRRACTTRNPRSCLKCRRGRCSGLSLALAVGTAFQWLVATYSYTAQIGAIGEQLIG